MLYSLSLFPRPFVWSCDQVKQSHRMAIVFPWLPERLLASDTNDESGCQNVRRNFSQCGVKLMSSARSPSGAGTKNFHPTLYCTPTIYSASPPSAHLWINRRSSGSPIHLLLDFQVSWGTQRAWSAFPTLSPPEFIWVPFEYQWHWICCKSRLSRSQLSSPWPAGEGWHPTQLELWSCFAKEWVANLA